MKNPARFKVVACGRRWGKTELALTAILIAAIIEDKRCWWLTPTYQMADQVWRDLKRAVKNLKGSKISQNERRIDLPNGGMIAVRSGHHPDNLRGEGLDFAVLDEAAFIDPRLWIEIIRPMLATTLGEALILSTPKGRNWFWQLRQLGLDPAQKDWAAFHFHSADNPLISTAELENIRSLSPEQVWKTEYEAHFSDDSGQVFRGIADAVAADQFNAPQPGHTYVAGVDWGRNNDYTAIAVIDVTSGVMIALDRFNQVGWELQRDRLKTLIQHWRPSIVWAEANSIGEPNIEALMGEGLPIRPFFTSAKTKSPLIESLALAIERGSLTLLNDPVLLSELANYSLERLPSGAWRYGAPPGGHDDTVIATALAWQATNYSALSFAFA